MGWQLFYRVKLQIWSSGDCEMDFFCLLVPNKNPGWIAPAALVCCIIANLFICLLFTLLVVAQVNKLHHNPTMDWTMNIKNFAFSFTHWACDTVIRNSISMSLLKSLKIKYIFFLQLDRCHPSENFNADDFISFYFFTEKKLNTTAAKVLPVKCWRETFIKEMICN